MSKKRILLDLRILAALVSMLARKHFLSNLHSPRTPKSNANARAAQLLTQTGQIGAYVLRSAFSVGVPKLIRQTQTVQIGA